jgi:hypothetical protein
MSSAPLARRLLAASAALYAAGAAAQSADDASKWSASINGSYYAMRDEADFGVAVAAINRGPLRFEARHNYEARHATSLFVGWKFSGHEALSYEVTPIAGVLFGDARGGIVGVEASAAYGALDAYIEAEYVHDRKDAAGHYVYAWSEIGFRPLEWLRVGIVGQRTRLVHTGRDLQRGPFIQFAFGKVSISLYAFNPEGASRYAVMSIAASY